MIYEYKCRDCKTIFEEQMPIEERNKIQRCPNCAAMEGYRIISRPNFDTGGTNSEKLARLGDDKKYRSNHS